jgi:AMP nucleosidase
MHDAPAFISPPHLPTERFTDAKAAVAQLEHIYRRNTTFLREQFEAFAAGTPLDARVRATYPFVRITTDTHGRMDSRLSYGFVSGPGTHETSVTRPDLFRDYFTEQIELLLANHRVPVEIGESREPIPVHFAYTSNIGIAASFVSGGMQAGPPLRDRFDVPDLATMDDAIADGTLQLPHGAPAPLAMFRAARVDYSLHRLIHYTGTDPEHFQNFVIFTNYQFYVDAFVRMCRERVAAGDAAYEAFVEPGNIVTRKGQPATQPALARLPQMPAYHLVAPKSRGITMINIGTGPSNARNITDHVAVLRPHAWLMLGHCAGLRNTQKLGDYVLAHGYVREDHVLDEELPLWVPIPALAEIQVALEQALAEVTGLSGYELKRIMRTGTVASVDNRNWELGNHAVVIHRLSLSRAVGLDMESAAIAANGFRFRVPYGTLLCVSDKPAWPPNSIASASASISRSDCARSRS